MSLLPPEGDTVLIVDSNAVSSCLIAFQRLKPSLVTTAAIDADAFLAAHGEIFATFGKIQPFLSQIRQLTGEPDTCKHLEAVVMAAPNAEAILARRREAARAAAKGKDKDIADC
jgi:hypothetical protein